MAAAAKQCPLMAATVGRGNTRVLARKRCVSVGQFAEAHVGVAAHDPFEVETVREELADSGGDEGGRTFGMLDLVQDCVEQIRATPD